MLVKFYIFFRKISIHEFIFSLARYKSMTPGKSQPPNIPKPDHLNNLNIVVLNHFKQLECCFCSQYFGMIDRKLIGSTIQTYPLHLRLLNIM
jgi:hypothetical protein